MSSSFISATGLVPNWACPFSSGDCGPNLEYDNAYLDLQKAALGKPETQFEPATPPDWNVVESASLELLASSRDLRIAVLWAESRLHLKGISSLPESLQAIAALIENAWSTVNPPLDDGDAYPRLNVIESLGFGGSFFQSLRNCVVVRSPRIGEVRLKDFEALTGGSTGTEPPVVRDHFTQFLRSPEGKATQLHQIVRESESSLNRMLNQLAGKVEADRVPQLSEIRSLLKQLQTCLPLEVTEQSSPLEPPSDLHEQHFSQQPAAGFGTSHTDSSGSVGCIRSRAHALAAIDQVCHYLEQAEPTNPAQLLLKRARRLIDKNFMQLMKDLAPEALAEVAKIMGVNPDSLEQEDV